MKKSTPPFQKSTPPFQKSTPPFQKSPLPSHTEWLSMICQMKSAGMIPDGTYTDFGKVVAAAAELWGRILETDWEYAVEHARSKINMSGNGRARWDEFTAEWLEKRNPGMNAERARFKSKAVKFQKKFDTIFNGLVWPSDYDKFLSRFIIEKGRKLTPKQRHAKFCEVVETSVNNMNRERILRHSEHRKPTISTVIYTREERIKELESKGLPLGIWGNTMKEGKVAVSALDACIEELTLEWEQNRNNEIEEARQRTKQLFAGFPGSEIEREDAEAWFGIWDKEQTSMRAKANAQKNKGIPKNRRNRKKSI